MESTLLLVSSLLCLNWNQKYKKKAPKQTFFFYSSVFWLFCETQQHHPVAQLGNAESPPTVIFARKAAELKIILNWLIKLQRRQSQQSTRTAINIKLPHETNLLDLFSLLRLNTAALSNVMQSHKRKSKGKTQNKTKQSEKKKPHCCFKPPDH